MPQQRQVVNVPSVRQHIRCGTDRPSVVAWKCAVSSLVSVEQQEDCSVTAMLCRPSCDSCHCWCAHYVNVNTHDVSPTQCSTLGNCTFRVWTVWIHCTLTGPPSDHSWRYFPTHHSMDEDTLCALQFFHSWLSLLWRLDSDILPIIFRNRLKTFLFDADTQQRICSCCNFGLHKLFRCCRRQTSSSSSDVVIVVDII